MFFSTVLATLLGASIVVARPTPRDGPVADTDILQVALTLEHLENAYYALGLKSYSAEDFAAAGFPDWVRGRYVELAAHEATHVQYLANALGSSATQPCEYSFPVTDAKSFVTLSMILEGVGASAYLGAATALENKTYLAAAGSILGVEARQNAWISSAVLKLQPWNGPFDAPLTLSGAFSLATGFIKGCPSSNPALPVKALPALTLTPAAPQPGSTVTVSIAGGNSNAKFLAYYNGLTMLFSPIASDGTSTVPASLDNSGTVYFGAVTDQVPPTDDTMVSGLAPVVYAFDSHVAVEAGDV